MDRLHIIHTNYNHKMFQQQKNDKNPIYEKKMLTSLKKKTPFFTPVNEKKHKLKILFLERTGTISLSYSTQISTILQLNRTSIYLYIYLYILFITLNKKT